MNLTHYRVTLLAPGLTAGHRFNIPAELIPIAPDTTVLEANLQASQIAQEAITLRVQPVYEAGAAPKDRAKRPRQRLLYALSDFLATCQDETLRQQLTTLKTTLS
jgi:hypothetical protein